MKKSTKIWLIAAAISIFLGTLIFVSALSVVGWDFAKTTAESYVTQEYEITESFESITLNSVRADIVVNTSQNEKSYVHCYTKSSNNVMVIDGVLTINANDDRRWYEFLTINAQRETIYITIPESEYNSLEINNRTGDIKIEKGVSFENLQIEGTTCDIEIYSSFKTIKVGITTGKIVLANITAENITLENTTGDLWAKDINCKNFYAKGTTGDTSLVNVIATESIHVERGTGDIELDRCDAETLYLKATTGDIEGTLLSDKTFSASSTTGEIDLPKISSGGKCEISTTTGDIEMEIVK